MQHVRLVRIRRLGLPVSAISAALVVLACGGGGGGGDDDDPNPPPGADTTAPQATLTSPANLATGVAGNVTLTATASDDVGVVGVEFQVDGAALGSAVTTAPYTTTLNAAGLTNGQHVLRVRARDAAGNVSAWSSATVLTSGGASRPAGFTSNEAYVSGLTGGGTAFAQAPDGRFFVATQTGALRIVKAGALLPTPFATIAVDSRGERGLLGVALHPNFASNGWVYVYATRDLGGGSQNVITRFTAVGDVSGGVETLLVTLPLLSTTAFNHNGGALHFGADGKLYVGVGDNATSARAQDRDDPFGKILRFNDDGSTPTDNPFYRAQNDPRSAVWAYGLRNPFTFAVQPGTGRIHINDVGQNTWEEIDLGVAGANYGWPQSEGPDDVGAGITGPLFAYKHSDATPRGSGPGGFLTGLAIAGGAFYPAGGAFPTGYRDQYYFADYASRFVARLDTANGNVAYTFATLADNPVDMTVGLDGALYVLTRGGIARISAP